MTGERIKKLRKEKGLTQEQLGNLLGVKKSAIAKYENNRVSNLKKDTIQKLSEIFDIIHELNKLDKEAKKNNGKNDKKAMMIKTTENKYKN